MSAVKTIYHKLVAYRYRKSFQFFDAIMHVKSSLSLNIENNGFICLLPGKAAKRVKKKT